MRVTKYKTKLTNDKKVTLEKELSVNYQAMDNKINSPEKVDKFAREFLRLHEDSEEYLYMICINTKLVMTGVFELSHGNVNSSIVSVREMFQKALLANAVNIILIHNHPSGDPTPSSEDINVTKKAKEAGELIGVSVLDHIIIGESKFCSLKERGNI